MNASLRAIAKQSVLGRDCFVPESSSEQAVHLRNDELQHFGVPFDI